MHGVDIYQPNRIMVIMREELNEEEIIRPPISTLLLGNVLEVDNSSIPFRTPGSLRLTMPPRLDHSATNR